MRGIGTYVAFGFSACPRRVRGGQDAQMPDARPLPVTANRGPANVQALVSAALIVWVGIGTLLAEAGGVLALRPLTHAGVLLWFGLNLLRFRGVERIFMAAAFIVVPLVYGFADQPGHVLAVALD